MRWGVLCDTGGFNICKYMQLMHTQHVQICTVYMFYWVHFDARGCVLV